jgi:60 kDa SS-A/Ro ribonucleoprotein
MSLNNAHGMTFTISPLKQFERFLILGSSGGTYYATEQKLTKDNAKVAVDIFSAPSDIGVEAIQLLKQISVEGRGPKVSPTLFALALAFSHGTLPVRHEAMKVFSSVVRTQSHLFEFISYVNPLRGWGRVLRETVASWYTSKTPDQLGYQFTKYRTRNDWSTKDALRMAHPVPKDAEMNDLFKWAVGKVVADESMLPQTVQAHIKAMASPDKPNIALINDFGLTREMVPNTWLNSVSVWEALLQKMPLHAALRNLSKMTNIGLLQPNSEATKLVISKLQDAEALQKARVHPFSILLALTTYQAGRGVKGSLTWTPVQKIVDALDAAFYLSFKNVAPTGKKILFAMDVSGSMDGSMVAGTHMTARTASVAFAMAVARLEEDYEFMAFSTSFIPLNISPKQRLDDIIRQTNRLPFGGTDCSLPVVWAKQKQRNFETVIIATDSETYAGRIQPVQALREYRQQVGHDVKLVVMGLTATNFTIADPKDSGMLDCVGADASLPQIVSDFIAEKI